MILVICDRKSPHLVAIGKNADDAHSSIKYSRDEAKIEGELCIAFGKK